MSTKNISLGGLFLLDVGRRAVGSMFEVGLEYGGESHRALCRVTHLQQDGIGVAFVEPEDDLRLFLQRAIDGVLSNTDGLSRRRQERQSTDLSVGWREGTVERRGKLENLSQGGAFIATKDGPEPGAELIVYLPGYTYAVGSGQPSEARGCVAMVVHKDRRGIGVRFANPSAEFRMAVEGVMRRDRR